MNQQKQNTGDEEKLKCDCGKLFAIRKGERIYVMCKNCRKQIDITQYLEPRA